MKLNMVEAFPPQNEDELPVTEPVVSHDSNTTRWLEIAERENADGQNVVQPYFHAGINE